MVNYKKVLFLRFWPIGIISGAYRGYVVVISWFSTARGEQKKCTIFKISKILRRKGTTKK